MNLSHFFFNNIYTNKIRVYPIHIFEETINAAKCQGEGEKKRRRRCKKVKKIKIAKQKVQLVLPPGQTPHHQYDILKKAQYLESENQPQILHPVIGLTYSSTSHFNSLNLSPCIIK